MVTLNETWFCYNCGYRGQDHDEEACPECGTDSGDGFGLAENEESRMFICEDCKCKIEDGKGGRWAKWQTDAPGPGTLTLCDDCLIKRGKEYKSPIDREES